MGRNFVVERLEIDVSHAQKRIRAVLVAAIVSNQQLKTLYGCSVKIRVGELIAHFLIDQSFFVDGVACAAVMRIAHMDFAISPGAFEI